MSSHPALQSNMLRISLFFFMAVFLAVRATPAPAAAAPRDLSYLAMESDEEMPELEDFRTSQFGELRTVLSTIKHQFREIIEEILQQVIDYFKEILKQLKVKLLKKLGLYSVSDVLRVGFDGVTDFLVEPVPEYYEHIKDPVVVEPSYGYRPFSLASFLGAKREAD